MRRGCPPVLLFLIALAGVSGCSDDGGGDLGAFCATARRFEADNPAAVFDHYDPADPASAAALLRDAADRLQGWAGEAPGEIDNDVEVIADGARALAEEFESPAAAPAEELQERVEAVEVASGRVLDFTRQNCQVDLDPGAGV